MPNDPRERPLDPEQPHEPADPAEEAEAIEAAAWGERIEVSAADMVDGDFNGAPELAGLEESRDWEAADVLDAIEGPEAGLERDERPLAVLLEELVAERHQVLVERMPEARAFGLGALFAATAAATAPDAGSAPLVADADVLRDRLKRLDRALARLEAASETRPGARPAPRPRLRTPARARPAGSRLVWLALLAAAGAFWARARRRRGRQRGGSNLASRFSTNASRASCESGEV